MAVQLPLSGPHFAQRIFWWHVTRTARTPDAGVRTPASEPPKVSWQGVQLGLGDAGVRATKIQLAGGRIRVRVSSIAVGIPTDFEGRQRGVPLAVFQEPPSHPGSSTPVATFSKSVGIPTEL